MRINIPITSVVICSFMICQISSLIAYPLRNLDDLLSAMSIEEKMDQLMLLSYDELADYPGRNFGAIEFTSKGQLEDFPILIDSLNPLRLAVLDDTSLNLKGWPNLKIGSNATLQQINHPHLFYEMGIFLGKYGKHTGLDGIIVSNPVLLAEVNNLNWRSDEFKQGLSSIGVDAIFPDQVIDFNGEFDDFVSLQGEGIVLYQVKASEITDFQDALINALSEGRIQENQINDMCGRILKLKSINAKGKSSKENDKNDSLKLEVDRDFLRNEVSVSTISVVRNDNGLLPIRDLTDLKVLCLMYDVENYDLVQSLRYYNEIDQLVIDPAKSDEQLTKIYEKTKDYDLLIWAIEKEQLDVHSDILNSAMAQFENQKRESFIVEIYLDDPGDSALPSGSDVSIITYENSHFKKLLTAELIFGALDLGEITLSETALNAGETTGIPILGVGRFGYTFPEMEGLDRNELMRIDQMAEEAIQAEAIPGCQIVVARNGQVVYQKSFGYHTYDSLREVVNTDLFDLASVTKVSGALPGIMKLYEEGKFDLDATLGTYLSYFKKGNKKELTFREILAHQAGLRPWIPYWQQAFKKSGKPKKKALSYTPDKKHSYQLNDDLYLNLDFKKKIYKSIKKSEVGEKKYLYSGLVFYLLPDIIESITGQSYEQYIYETFYKPLGASRLTYNPLNKFDKDEIVPTEYDSLFRKGQIHGIVHDEGAATMGGVSSNAGLFSNANDLAKLFQMYCNYGSYGGKQYIKPETLQEFTRCQYPENDNRRGLGFDRPMEEPSRTGNAAYSASELSFGHSGFTGTFAWADPKYNLVYIFLSNRVYQTRENNKLGQMNVRTNIQQVIYDAMVSSDD